MSNYHFQDHFSDVSKLYYTFRPRYPSSLFEYLASIANRRDLAWDCATGNGQAATALAQHFNQVIATDASENQIANSEQHSRVQYKVASAENSSLETKSVDLVTVAQALHWLDLPAFYTETRRILKPKGILAVWSYGKMDMENTKVRSVLGRYYHETVGPFWPAQRLHVENKYADLDFPFVEIEPPAFTIESAMVLEEIIGYVRTWSATQQYIEKHGVDPVNDLEQEIHKLWADPDMPVTVRWRIALRIGRI